MSVEKIKIGNQLIKIGDQIYICPFKFAQARGRSASYNGVRTISEISISGNRIDFVDVHNVLFCSGYGYIMLEDGSYI